MTSLTIQEIITRYWKNNRISLNENEHIGTWIQIQDRFRENSFMGRQTFRPTTK